jgi:beta-glucosidase
MPQSIYWGTRFCSELYPVKAIYITENGCGYREAPNENGEILDLHRVQYLRSYLEHVHRACTDGVPIKG